MTTEELDAKLKPYPPQEGTYPGNDWYPSGKADGVIFRKSKKVYITRNGKTIQKGSTPKPGTEDEFIAPADIAGERIIRRAFQYVQYASEADRTLPFGMTLNLGITVHLGGFIDQLAVHFPCLKAERDKGFILDHVMASTKIGKMAMHPEIFAFLKVVPVEEGIFAVIYDPGDDLAVERKARTVTETLK